MWSLCSFLFAIRHWKSSRGRSIGGLGQDNPCWDSCTTLSVYCMRYTNRSMQFGTRPGRNGGTANLALSKNYKIRLTILTLTNWHCLCGSMTTFLLPIKAWSFVFFVFFFYILDWLKKNNIQGLKSNKCHLARSIDFKVLRLIFGRRKASWSLCFLPLQLPSLHM